MSLAVLLAATAAVIAFSTSALVGLGLAATPARRLRLSAAAEARFLLVAALLPFLVTVVVMTATMAPSFGWIADHCLTSPDVHEHPHLCGHHIAGFPGAPLVGLALLLAARLAVGGVSAVVGALRLAVTRRQLDRSCVPRAGMRVLPVDEPQAFLLGVFRPRLFVTRGLLGLDRARDAEVVIAHERAHLERRDPLRRQLARIGLPFHLPGVARAIERRLARAHEMAADAEAAREVGSRERVAETLVQVMRAQVRRPRAGLAFEATSTADMEARVRRLLDHDPDRDGPGVAALAAGVCTVQAVVLLAADTVHHGVEHVLGLLGG